MASSSGVGGWEARVEIDGIWRRIITIRVSEAAGNYIPTSTLDAAFNISYANLKAERIAILKPRGSSAAVVDIRNLLAEMGCAEPDPKLAKVAAVYDMAGATEHACIPLHSINIVMLPDPAFFVPVFNLMSGPNLRNPYVRP